MLLAYIHDTKFDLQVITADNERLLQHAIWIDLLFPTKEEEALLEKHLGFKVPTREDMIEIELSSRLYKENDAIFMTATMLAQSDSHDPKLDPVTFIMNAKQLVTIRYIEPQAFKIIPPHLRRLDPTHNHATGFLLELLDATVDRLADTLELVGRRLDEDSKTIFRNHNTEKLDYHQIMMCTGSNGDLNTKARESLLTFSRLIAFFGQNGCFRIDNDCQLRLNALSKDLTSLADHANFLSSKVNFLLDATLGMVNIEQNNIIKIFSVASVVFLPPTLIASIYGMNFHTMPELEWRYGYAYAIGLILLGAWLPYKYFKYKKWL